MSDRIPPGAEPEDKKIEQAVIGACLQFPEAVQSAKNILSPDHFYLKNHRKIFQTILDLSNGKPADLLVISDELKKQGLLKEIGGSYYLTVCIGESYTSASVEYHAKIIKERALRRNLIEELHRIQYECYLGGDFSVIVEDGFKKLNELRRECFSNGDFGKAFCNGEELMEMKIPERNIIFPFLPEGGSILIFGTRGIGKTFLSLSFSIAIIKGKHFIKWESPEKPLPVLYIDGELGLHAMRNRLFLFTKDIPKNFYLLSREAFFRKTKKDLNLALPEHQQIVSDFLSDHPDVKVVVVDSISRLFKGIKEDSADDWKDVIEPWLAELQQVRKIAVILIHHAGKSGDQRGTSVREDAVDTVIKLIKGTREEREGANFIIKFTKDRCPPEVDLKPVEVTLNFQNPNHWDVNEYSDSSEIKMLKSIVDAVQMGLTHGNEIAHELGYTPARISQCKKRGIKLKMFKKSNEFILTENCSKILDGL